MTLRLTWGTGIGLAYVAFATATTGFVVFAIGRPVDLVSPDYYARSLQQDRQMAAIRNADALGAAASIVPAGDRTAIVSLPAPLAGSARGTITLYRAADASADRVLDLRLDASGRQTVAFDGLPTGRWSVRVRWMADGREFYLERSLVTR